MKAPSSIKAPSSSVRYERVLRLAAGGMAEVYVARAIGHEGFEKLVALKRILPSFAEDTKFRAMFLDEARLTALIRSPNVVPTLDLGVDSDGGLFLVMELIPGVTLSRWLGAREGSELPLPVVSQILVDVASGVHDAHETCDLLGNSLGIVHRDISPSNVLVQRNGEIFVTDFGVASAEAEIRETKTETGELKGKFSYLSPEQASGRPVDRRSDVFALGILGWELLAGRRLFKAVTPAESVRILLYDPVPDLPPRCGPLEPVVRKALARAPEDRFPTALEFAEAIRQAMAPSGRSTVKLTLAEDCGADIARLDRAIREAVDGSGRHPVATEVAEDPLPISHVTATQPPTVPARVRANRRKSPVVYVAGVAVGLAACAGLLVSQWPEERVEVRETGSEGGGESSVPSTNDAPTRETSQDAPMTDPSAIQPASVATSDAADQPARVPGPLAPHAGRRLRVRATVEEAPPATMVAAPMGSMDPSTAEPQPSPSNAEPAIDPVAPAPRGLRGSAEFERLLR